MRISAIIIGYNEAKYIERCLNNCAQWADEIIYFDSFSTDGSDEFAVRQENVKLYKHRYDNTRNQRNRALDVAKGEWRFLLDVDEYLSDPLIGWINLPGWLENHPFDTLELFRHNVVDNVDMGHERTIHLVKRGIIHGGHPLHADRAANKKSIGQVGPMHSCVEHQKTSIQWCERMRIYYWMEPHKYLAGPGIPPGSEDLVPPEKNYKDRNEMDVMTEFMDAGLDKRLTEGYLKAQGLEITEKGWRRKK